MTPTVTEIQDETKEVAHELESVAATVTLMVTYIFHHAEDGFPRTVEAALFGVERQLASIASDVNKIIDRLEAAKDSQKAGMQ